MTPSIRSLFFWLFVSAGVARAGWTPSWLSAGGVPGVDGTVNTLTLWDRDGSGPQPAVIIIGGEFSLAGNVPAGNIACWNPATQSWRALGSGVNGSVYAVAVLGDRVYAGGYFTNVGGITVTGVACWDEGTQTWSPLGGGLSTVSPSSRPATVTALHVLNGKVYAAGYFTTAGGIGASHIACWDPATSTWSALGTGLTNTAYRYDYALASLGGKLYVGGEFSTAGGVSAQKIACWDPDTSTWSALGAGLGGTEYAAVYDLAVLEGVLFVAGDFGTAGTEAANHFAVWEPNGQAWVAAGSTTTPIRALAVDVDRIYALHTAPKGEISVWDLSTWEWTDLTPALSGGVAYNAGALALLDRKLYAGGDFRSAGGNLATGIAVFDLDALSWSRLGSGTDNHVLAVTDLDNRVYVGGRFCEIGGQAASRIASLDTQTSTWMALGDGLDDDVLALAAGDGKVYAGGEFTMAGGSAANRIAAWDTATLSWSPLGVGVNGPNPVVTALVVLNGKVYAGGRFTTAGATE